MSLSSPAARPRCRGGALHRVRLIGLVVALLVALGAGAGCGSLTTSGGDDGRSPTEIDGDYPGVRDASMPPSSDADITSIEPTLPDAGLDSGGLMDGGVPFPPGDAGAPTTQAAAFCGTFVAAAGFECDVRQADACGARAWCAIADRGARCESSAPRAEGEPCTRSSECGPVLGCFGEPGHGRCGRLCCGNAGCAEGEFCGGDGKLADGYASDVRQCLPVDGCNVLAPSVSCPTGEGCYIVTEHGATACLPEGGLPLGARCERPQDCSPGGACVGAGATACVQVCALSAPGSCGEGETCRPQAHTPSGAGLCTRVTSAPTAR